MPLPGSPEGFEDHIDRLIREAVQRGEFDDLPGTGKPIPGAGSKDDDLWWIRRWVRQNLGEDEPESQDEDSSSSS